ncbi:hypothetical protein J010_03558 [Cryptococcus neoformans]|nr:hypothetical protein C355_03437 [Cryptococcus neoformans var. grubii Th84]OXH09798.1 hypothetical protein J010_03558 [Cryptococcus neoformans var. grubii]OXH30737.1 hypothetical protein J009_03574 [Cryptococcus neoformans var. grubii]OXH50823.1 hypothetical protein J004_03625 [Cryptococcus neoformans var. grubii]OXH51264.1 hypothetical protein J003_03560 [Cryptococcus neoformans var. grubii]
MSEGNIFQEQVIELQALLRQHMALSRLKNTVHSEVDLTHEKELHEELVEGFKLGGIDLTDDNTADNLHLYDSSGLDQEFSIDLLIKGSRSIEAHLNKTVFEKFMSTNGDILSREMYGVLRWLKWSVAPDFGFDQEKSLDIQVFRDDELSEPFFYPINDRTIQSIHPVALVRVPQKPVDPNGPWVIVTIPIARHT